MEQPPTPAPTPAPAPAPAAPAPAYVTAAELQTFGKSLMSEITKALKPAPTPTEELTLKEQITTLRSENADIISAGRSTKLEALALKIGVDPELIGTFQREFEAANPNVKFNVKTGLYTDEGVAVEKLATDFLSTKLGSLLKKSVQTASIPGRQRGTPAPTDRPFYAELSAETRSKMTQAERAAYAQEDLRRNKSA